MRNKRTTRSERESREVMRISIRFAHYLLNKRRKKKEFKCVVNKGNQSAKNWTVCAIHKHSHTQLESWSSNSIFLAFHSHSSARNRWQNSREVLSHLDAATIIIAGERLRESKSNGKQSRIRAKAIRRQLFAQSVQYQRVMLNRVGAHMILLQKVFT